MDCYSCEKAINFEANCSYREFLEEILPKKYFVQGRRTWLIHVL
jgi:hypothetical protein